MAGVGVMSECVANCGTAVDNFYLCKRCTDEFAETLRAVEWLVVELEVTVSRQTSFGPQLGPVRPSAEQPLPYHPRASSVASRLQSELSTWAWELAGMRGESFESVTTVDLAGWLLRNVDAVRMHPQAGSIVATISDAVRAAERVVDRPADKWYMGPCDYCDEDMYARSRSGEVQCGSCLKKYDIEERREYLLGALNDMWGTADEVSKTLSFLGVRVKAQKIYNLAHYGNLTKLPPHPADERKAPRYRVEDVLEALGRAT